MSISRRGATLVLALLVIPAAEVAAREAIEPVDGAAEARETRNFRVEDPVILLRAAIAVLQDIRYFVAEAQVEPGLLVAESTHSGCRCRETVTLSLDVDSAAPATLVRVTRSTPPGLAERPDDDFEQRFFVHLQRELHREVRP